MNQWVSEWERARKKCWIMKVSSLREERTLVHPKLANRLNSNLIIRCCCLAPTIKVELWVSIENKGRGYVSSNDNHVKVALQSLQVAACSWIYSDASWPAYFLNVPILAPTYQHINISILQAAVMQVDTRPPDKSATLQTLIIGPIYKYLVCFLLHSFHHVMKLNILIFIK